MPICEIVRMFMCTCAYVHVNLCSFRSFEVQASARTSYKDKTFQDQR